MIRLYPVMLQTGQVGGVCPWEGGLIGKVILQCLEDYELLGINCDQPLPQLTLPYQDTDQNGKMGRKQLYITKLFHFSC